MIKKIIISVLFLLISCESKKVGKIVINDYNKDSLYEEVKLYIANFENTKIEANIFLRNKITGKDSIIDENIVENELDYKNHIIKELNRFTLIRNDIYVEIEDLTSIVLSDVGYSSYCVIYAEERNKKIDFYISLRPSPPEIRLKSDKKRRNRARTKSAVGDNDD